MRNKKEFLAAVKRSKTSPGKSKESNLAQTARLIAAVEQVTQLRSRIGSGDSSLERTLLELHEETGLNILEIGNLPAREFQRILKAAIRKRDSRNWIPVATEHLRNERTRLSRMAKTPNESGLRRIVHGQYQVRKDKLGLLIKPSALNLYRN
jgi:hypothetical protein